MAGGLLQMEECASMPDASDGRSVFAATPTGQLKMPAMGNFCISVVGDGAMSSDLSKGAEAIATSSSAAHSASSAIDGSTDSYWASSLDPASAVSMDLDFGTTKIIEKITAFRMASRPTLMDFDPNLAPTWGVETLAF